MVPRICTSGVSLDLTDRDDKCVVTLLGSLSLSDCKTLMSVKRERRKRRWVCVRRSKFSNKKKERKKEKFMFSWKQKSLYSDSTPHRRTMPCKLLWRFVVVCVWVFVRTLVCSVDIYVRSSKILLHFHRRPYSFCRQIWGTER